MLSPERRAEIARLTAGVEPEMVACRRDFHKHAESGWTEFRTASLIARRLADLGLDVQAGPAVVKDEDRMGLPSPDELKRHWQRALDQGGDPEYLEILKGGFTGVVGILRHGDGPTIGMRFDIDANDLEESSAPGHRPIQEGFSSINPGASHGCGHDGHGAIGLAIANVLTKLREELHGTVKLIFQPAEEGVRGAKAMVSAGVVDDVDCMLCQHLYSGWPMGDYRAGRGVYLATTKFDATIVGAPAHAGGSPHGGKNAMLAAATAVLNLYAIPRHREGMTRINVGRLNAGVGRNVICPQAHMAIETRGQTSELNDFMYQRAITIIRSAAEMYGCSLEIRQMGNAQSATSDPKLVQRIEEIAHELGGFTPRAPEGGGGSEDYTYMMRRVQERGGLATNIGIGADLGGFGHHTAEFDFDERGMAKAVELLTAIAMDLMENPIKRA